MKRAIVIGASSGIGKELAKVLSAKGYEVGLVARRIDLLQELQKEISTKTYISQVDIAEDSAIGKIEDLIRQMGDVELIVINSGIGFINPELDWQQEKQTIEVNVRGFCAMAGMAYKYFKNHGSGHIVGVSSIASLFGSDAAPAYSASKAFMNNYLLGLRKKAFKDGKPIAVKINP